VAEKTSGEPKPSLAVLSLGCGTTSELPHVDPNEGAWGWAVDGNDQPFDVMAVRSMFVICIC
jgi:hypothetical protein